ncbi:MAG TPA: hypothetical protein PKC24_14470, partial [Cyclobacteriaceae bacterium]|nr:hypothetical protein [Cyclobacteriaceae bacterium]
QTQGKIEDDRRVGTWKLFDREGNLSGYYRPFYDDNIRLKPIASGRSANNEGKGFNYFATQPNEFRGVIISLSPFTTFLGTLPIGIEFFNDERLGHEFEFESIRNPFYTNDANIDLNTVYTRGYSIALKQKFYNSMAGKSQWYFGHEIRLVNLSHFNNITLPMFPNTQIKASATEQRAEYGLILGLRVFQRTKSKGLTCDLFAGYNIGVRGFQVDELFQPAFEEINQKRFSNTYRFGINIGYLFTSEKR